MSNAIHSLPLPAVLHEKLRSIRRRQAVLIVCRSLAVAASVLIGAMLLAMLVDWWTTLFSPALRITLTAASIALAAAACLAAGVRPLLSALGWKSAAASAEEHVPQLEERWTTVASFAASRHRPNTPEGEAMLQQVTSEAVALGRLVKPRGVARVESIKPAALMLGACLLVLAAFLALDWPQTSVLLRRFWSPTASITATQLRSLTGDVVVPRGETLELLVEQSGKHRDSALLTLRYDSGAADVFELASDDADPSAGFRHTLRAAETFQYRVRAGDGQTDWHAVRVIDHPTLAEVRFKVTSPEYVDRPPYEKSLIPGRMRVVQGSRLELAMKPLEELARLELLLTFTGDDDEETQTVLLTPDADGWYRVESQLLQDVSLSPVLFSPHGLTNADRPVCHIQVIPDQAPVARVISPTDDQAVAADEVLDIQFEAHDDHGIATAELVVYDETAKDSGDEPRILRVQPIPLGDQQSQKHIAATTQLDLKALNLEHGRSISYAVRVTDNREVPIAADAMSPRRGPAAPRAENNDQHMADADSLADMDAARNAADSGEAGDRDPDGVSGADNQVADAGNLTDNPELRIEADKADPTGTGKDMPDSETAPAQTEDKPQTATDAAGERQPSESPEPSATPRSATPSTPEKDSPASPENSPVPEPEQAKSPDGERGPAEPAPEKPAAEEGHRNGGTAIAKNDAPKAETSEPGETKPADGLPPDSVAQQPAEPRPATGEDAPDANADSVPQPGRESPRIAANGSPQESADPQPPSPFMLSPQQGQEGQRSETGRRTLKIAERLTAVAAADERDPATAGTDIRERVVAIDTMLADVEEGLKRVVEREIPDSDRSRQCTLLDEQLGGIEAYIAELRQETKDGEFAFVGLQMLDIGRTHVTPARDRVFVAIRDPGGAGSQTAEALQHVIRARELLAALLKRYDDAARDLKLADTLDSAVTMYEVYVEKMQQLMREARQNKNPLRRKMEIIEVDQEYLDRYAEVLTLRREMMAEFARLLADDPRLLSRYMDMIKRRRNSLRDRLTELAERQHEAATEVSGWLAAGDDQRGDLWMLLAEMRLHAATPLARDAAELAERIEKQMPLVLDPDVGAAARVIEHAQAAARLARDITLRADRIEPNGPPAEGESALVSSAEELTWTMAELDAALDRLAFENEQEAEVTDYVARRLVESRTVADQAEAWRRTAGFLDARRYAGLAEVDQEKLTIATELLRVDMLGMGTELEGEFQRQLESGMPAEIAGTIAELQRVMESITFNQQAAGFASSRDRLDAAAAQQELALAGFDRAEELFDQIRRAVVDALDESEGENPNIADLEDPTLDEFLAQLEREPNIEALLAIPNRPRNLRVVAETMVWQQEGGDMLNGSVEQAMQRARQALREQPDRPPGEEKPEPELSEEERARQMTAEEMQEMIDKSLAEVRKKQNDPETTPEERRRLEPMAENLKRMREAGGQSQDAQIWDRLAQSDEAREILRALARGEPIPDQQWNRLMSTLNERLWQVGGRTPPEEYRKAIEQYQDRIRQLDPFGREDK